MNRRTFLTSFGLASGGLLWSQLRSRSALAAGAEPPPRRFIVFVTQFGAWYDGWKLRPTGVTETGAWTRGLAELPIEQFSEGLRPLFPLRSRVSIVDGVSLVSAAFETAGRREDIARAHALTGGRVRVEAGRAVGTTASIDQRIAEVIGRPDQLRSLQLALGQAPFPVTYRADGQVLWPETDLAQLHHRLFGPTGDAAAATYQTDLAARDAVVTRLASRLGELSGALGVVDQQKIAAHRTQLVEFNARMSAVAKVQCTPPPAPGASPSYSDDFASIVGILQAAFSCDLTRVATVQCGPVPITLIDPSMTGDLQEDYARKVYGSAAAQQVMTKYTAYHAQQFAQLMTALDSVPEGQGTLLDSTLCLWVSDIADGATGFERWPVVYGGGGAGSNLKMGQYHYLPSTTPMDGWGFNKKLEVMATPHQKLLTTLCKAMSVDLDAMPMTEVIGKDCAFIDCRGTLDGLA